MGACFSEEVIGLAAKKNPKLDHAYLNENGEVLAILVEPARYAASFKKEKGLNTVSGTYGWYEFDFDSSKGEGQPFFLTVSFAALGLRPLIAVLDNSLLDIVCGGTTGGWGTEDIQSHVYGPFSFPKGGDPSKRTLRFETPDWHFPPVSKIVVTAVPTSDVVGHLANNSAQYRRYCIEHLPSSNVPATVANLYHALLQSLDVAASSNSGSIPYRRPVFPTSSLSAKRDPSKDHLFLREHGEVVELLQEPHRTCDRFLRDQGFNIVKGLDGWYEYDFDATKLHKKPFFLVVSFASLDLRPLLVKLDGVLLDIVCGGTTGGWDQKDVQSHVYGPFTLTTSATSTVTATSSSDGSAHVTPSSTQHCLRFETIEHQFPYVSEVLITSAPHVGHMENNSVEYHNLCREHLQWPGIVAMETAQAYMDMLATVESQRIEKLNSGTTSDVSVSHGADEPSMGTPVSTSSLGSVVISNVPMRSTDEFTSKSAPAKNDESVPLPPAPPSKETEEQSSGESAATVISAVPSPPLPSGSSPYQKLPTDDTN